ncbi:MAG: inositol monophosphatase family protein [Verrucomicrobiales bacterium]
MRLSSQDLNHLLTLAIEAACRAGAYVQSRAGRHGEVLTKEGGGSQASQVVTEVDFESQRLILGTLHESIASFELGLLTEEGQDDNSRHERDHFWCIDPLDGTLPFVENVAGYSVSIALVSRQGEPMLGVIQDPVTGVLYHAMSGGGAFRDNQPFTPQNVSETLTLVVDRSFQRQQNYSQLLSGIERLAAEHGLSGVKIISQGGAAMNACWVIENAPAVYFKQPKSSPGGGSLWDFAASACIFRELGAVATDAAGGPLKLNRKGSTFMNADGVLYASSVSLAAGMTAFLRET